MELVHYIHCPLLCRLYNYIITLHQLLSWMWCHKTLYNYVIALCYLSPPPLQIFLVADVMYSFLVHQYDLKHGLPRLDQLGKPVKLKLY